jgi:biotin-dependent carboxylase-like uncharacterized protein
MTARGLDVVVAGPFTTVQDRGRPGLAAWGVGRSGAADRTSAALANRLVANRSGAALLEATLGGLTVRAVGALTVALTGADPQARIDGRPVVLAGPVALVDGAVLELGRPVRGLRTYLAVRGGIDVPAVLGSRSYDALSGLGPAPVRSGDRLDVGPEPKHWPVVDSVPSWPAGGPVAEPDVRTVLTGRSGPHAEALGPGAAVQLAATWWTVSPDSDRTGLRVEGPALRRADGGEWPVEGLVRGAIQLPPSGRPVLLLADHPVTGGYPAIGALDERSCDRAAQLRPGDQVRLELRSR